MAEQIARGRFRSLVTELTSGGLSRRQFLERALALGVGFSVANFVANAAMAAPGRPRAGWAVVHQDGAAGRPAVGMEGKSRGEGGEVKLLQWQAPTQLSPHVSTGTKDFLAASLVLEPLMYYLADGSIIPNLVEAVPTVENGLLAEDLTSATFTLLPGVLWSDGEPLTTADVEYTWKWVTDHPDVVPEGETNASVNIASWQPIETIEIVDELTFTVRYPQANVNWFVPFSGTVIGYVYPKHVMEQEGGAERMLQDPVGTGPYRVESFTPNDQVIYAINENYREPNKPFFATVNLKGGGDAASAARAVLQTGDWDYAWNLQVEPSVIEDLLEGGRGQFVVAPGTSVERININFSDPNTELDGQRSNKDVPHPFLTDPAVRQAMNLAVPRDIISTQFYGEGEPPTANILNGLPSFDSPNTSWEFNLERAAQILEEAGWVMDGDVRAKDGVELEVTYATSINAVRQKTQAVVKEAFESIGIKVQLQQIDAGIFFDGSPGNEQNINHLYVDINMYTSSPSTPVPADFMNNWYAGPDGSNIAQASNQWNGQNFHRWANAEYDALYEQLLVTPDLEAAAELLIQMNDLLIQEVVVIPEVNRAADKYAISNRLQNENVALGPFEVNYWNIANWVTVDE
jgi:peptide/nickel transport system substrate-binding protein